MEASIAAIASADDDARAAGIQANSAAVLSWLASREHNWLIIFDGADGRYEEVESFIPAGKRGNILISTRNSDMQRLASSFDAFINVTELDQDAAVALFIRSARLSSPSPSEQVHIEAIVQELCCLPLAVDQAASSIANRLCRVDEYLNTYKQHRLRLMDNVTFKGSSNYGRAVYTTWDISMAELERRAKAEGSDSVSYKAAILLLQLFSFFHFDGIREDTFRRAATARGKWLPPLPPSSQLLLLLQQTDDNDWDFFNFRQAIHVLSMFSLVHSAGSSTYSMHRLVHQWMQDRLLKSHRGPIALLAADVLARSEDDGESSDDHAHRQALLVHLVTLTVHLKQNGLMHQLSAETLWRIAKVYRSGGKPVDAEALLRQAASLVKKDNSKAMEQYMDIMFDLAAALYDSAKEKEAVTIERDILEWRKVHLGMGHPDTYRIMGNLADTLRHLGGLVEARGLMMQVLEWQKVHLGMGHPHTYRTMSDLAITFCHLGKPVEARGLLMQVLEWRKVHLGMDHPGTYYAMGELATTLCQLGEPAEARGLLMQVLEWQKVHLGMGHPDTYMTMGELAITLRQLGELAEARGLLMQVLEWRKVHLGMGNPATYYTMSELAITLRHLGEPAEARGLLMQVLEWDKVHLGMDRPDTYWTMGELAITLRQLGEPAEARGLLMQVLEWRKVHLGMGHPNTSWTMGEIAITLRQLGEPVETRSAWGTCRGKRVARGTVLNGGRTILD
jgi:tetratricopeptide (TPR) repeat protein